MAFCVLQVDLKDSSKMRINSYERAKIYRAMENLFQLCVGNEGVSSERYSWAGEGGFALFEDRSQKENHHAVSALRAAEQFSAMIDLVINPTYLEISSESLGHPQFRISIAAMELTPPHEGAKLSIHAGWEFSNFLKNERNFSKPGYICIWDEVYKLLPSRLELQKSFKESGTLVDSKKIWEKKAFRTLTTPTNLLLSQKDQIDAVTQTYLMMEGSNRQINKSLKDKLKKVFFQPFDGTDDSDDIYTEVICYIHQFFKDTSSGVNFRVAYYSIDEANNTLKFKTGFQSEAMAGFSKEPIPLKNQFTAGFSFLAGEPKYIPDVEEELKNDELNRRFSRLYEDQDINNIKSLLCIPVISSFAKKLIPSNIARRYSNILPIKHGVVCIDSDTNNFFQEHYALSVAERIGTLVREIAIGELMEDLLEKTDGSLLGSGEGASQSRSKNGKAKRRTP